MAGGKVGRSLCCSKRSVERVFYQHIVGLVLTAALAIGVWLVIRHAHLENFTTSHGWANSYRQMILLAKISQKVQQAVLPNIDLDRVVDDITDEYKSFTDYYSKTHVCDQARFRHLITDDHNQAIENWIDSVAAFLQRAKQSNSITDLAGEVSRCTEPCEKALVAIMHGYTLAMTKIAEMRYDIAGMIFLALLTFITIGQMFLVRTEYLQQLATVQLAEELAGVIHDVRIPQQVIVSAMQMLSLPDTDAATSKEMTKVISDSSSAIQRLLDTALLRIRTRAKSEPVRLSGVFRDVSKVLEVACREKGLAWRFDLGSSADTVVLVDVNAMLQIVNNLVSNAIRYTEKGHVTLCVHLEQPARSRFSIFGSKSLKMHTLVITVTDTGCGIPKDSMALIFKKFQQIQAGTGFGIGLFTVARLADSLQGRIDLWSELGKGTRFALSIPVALVHNHSNLTTRSGTYGR